MNKKQIRLRVFTAASLALAMTTMTGSISVNAQSTPNFTLVDTLAVGNGSTGIKLLPDDPEANYEGARVVHNVTVNGEKGMRVHAKFGVKYGLGVHCRMIAYFYMGDGAPLKAGDDPKYADRSHHVSAYTRFTPAYDPAEYSDLQIFMPYSALNMESGDQYDLKFYLQLFDEDGNRFFGKSGWYTFHITIP